MYNTSIMWVRCNPNPHHNEQAPDCVIRAISIALGLSWYEVFDDLSSVARAACSVTCDDHVWGKYLFDKGFIPFKLPNRCPECISVKQFCEKFSNGTFIIGTGSHAVAIINGKYYDSWDSGDTIASFFWIITK